MKKNMGSADSIIRVIVAVVLATLIMKGLITGTVAIVAGIAAGIFVITGIVGFCPLYTLFGLSTKNKK
jgi:hypothetical protein